jgi:2-oxoglutarate ferredoxin oxidoreductase subunit alpha
MAKRILMCGNEAVGEGAILAGCQFYAGYPITPQNELTAYMARRMVELDRTFIQSESEIAGINMVFGAAAAGARAMTSSSSPGISLKQEGISYLAACELPAVIVNMMRGGPGLGNLAPSQADYIQATNGCGHGDYRQIVLAPASVQELLELTYLAFDLADAYRTPVMILGDGILGQMMEPVEISLTPRKEFPPKPWAVNGCSGRKPNVIRSLLLGDGELEALNVRLKDKYELIKSREIRVEKFMDGDSDVFVVAYGTTSRICRDAVLRARSWGKKVSLFRPITLWPFPYQAIREAAERAREFLVVEMSMGQMVEDVMLGVSGKCPVRFYGRTGGAVPGMEEVLEQLK